MRTIRNLPRVVGIERAMWYGRLSRVNLEIVELREVIAAHIRQINLMSDHDVGLDLACALLIGFEGRLREHYACREFLMEKLRQFPKHDKSPQELMSMRLANDNAGK